MALTKASEHGKREESKRRYRKVNFETISRKRKQSHSTYVPFASSTTVAIGNSVSSKSNVNKPSGCTFGFVSDVVEVSAWAWEKIFVVEWVCSRETRAKASVVEIDPSCTSGSSSGASFMADYLWGTRKSIKKWWWSCNTESHQFACERPRFNQLSFNLDYRARHSSFFLEVMIDCTEVNIWCVSRRRRTCCSSTEVYPSSSSFYRKHQPDIRPFSWKRFSLDTSPPNRHIREESNESDQKCPKQKEY